ncbi:VPS10 domain-containing protein [Tenacibaculum amylolyticum]|uniref:VPS10 domain-containing protein n=1 Tax=Tenacibaculum amylolyticum TaxID=104269 RepID=UPI003895E320
MKKVTLAGKLCLLGLSLLTTTTVKAQRVFELMNTEGVSLKEVQLEAEKYFKKVGQSHSGYKTFKRWEYQALKNLQPDGTVMSQRDMTKASQKIMSLRNNSRQTSPSNWKELGPLTISHAANGNHTGIGRIIAIAVEPKKQQLIYAGSPGGGLWKSINAGNSWTPLGDQFDNMHIGAIAIHPIDKKTIYIGNGSGALMKSTDGGNSFQTLHSISRAINTILINPENVDDIYISSRHSGLFHSIDGGLNWTKVINEGIEDVLFKPGNTNTVYACGDNFFKSIDGGTSFTKKTTGIRASDRMKIAVSPASPNYVYILQKGGNHFGQLYRSTNSGENFVVRIDRAATGSTSWYDDLIGQQAWRDMAIAVSNTNANEVHIGGLNMFKSTNGGRKFVKECDWANFNGRNYVHADIEVIQYINGNIYVGSDGGIYRSKNKGGTFAELTAGMGIQQFYKISNAPTNKNRIVAGAQDNGSAIMSGTAHVWKRWHGGDGMDCVVHPKNANIVYSSIQNGYLTKTINGGRTETPIARTPEDANGNWVTPLGVDFSNGDRVYAGYKNLYRNDNGARPGSKWINISSKIDFGGLLDHIELCPSNNRVIYVAKDDRLFKGTNITSNNPKWTSLTGFSGYINDIAVDPFNENNVAIATSSRHVYISNNGGNSWSRIDNGLPSGISVTSLVFDKSANKGIYASLRGAVYFKNKTTNGWVTFSNNLPNVSISEIELYYGTKSSDSKIRMATYGRGVWESSLYDTQTNGNNASNCTNIVDSFPNNSNFSTNFNNWKHSANDDFNWRRHQGGTETSQTGPSNAPDNNFYIYAEASGNTNGKIATITSPCYDLTKNEYSEVRFMYHMSGSDIGTLQLEYTINDYDWHTLWEKSGDQGSDWIEETIDLIPYKFDTIKFRLKATTGEGEKGDIAVDMFTVRKLTPKLTCDSEIDIFPYTESFETGFNNWTNIDGDDFDWTHRQGGTPSSSTGPSEAKDGTYYVYIEASGNNNPNKSAILQTPCLNFTELQNPELRFNYHMYGGHVGNLKLEASKDGYFWDEIWFKKEDQGNMWHTATINLQQYAKEAIQIRFVGTSRYYQSDIAIDQIVIEDKKISPPIETPNCINTISEFPYSQSFENGLGNWADATNDHFNWTRKSGRTPSNETGPSSAQHGNYYMFIEASRPNHPSKNAKLLTPCLDLTNTTNPVVTFKYHMYGRNINRLNIALTTNDTRWKRVWTEVGAQGNSWKTGTLDLSEYAGKIVRLRFVGVTGDSSKGDIAIDNITITNNSDNKYNTTAENLEFTSETIAIYPNPVTTEMHIQLFTNNEQISVNLYNTMGILVKTDRFETRNGINLVKLNVEELSTGMYILEIQKGEDRITKKILVK